MASTVLDELITIIGFKGDTRDLDRVQARLKQVQSNINTVARNFGIAGAALTGVGFVVGRTILSFDRAMNTLRATFLDVPAEQIQRLEKQARDLGESTSKSATDAANAQVELARAGLDANQVMKAIPDVLNLAIAGELEMAEAAGLVTNQLASFRLETTETERVVDVLAKTATSSKTTVAELGPAFRQVAPLAAGLGIEIEQTAAIIGTLRSGGLIPEQAGTAFRNILAILQEDPTSRVRDGFKQLGLEFEDVRQMVTEGDLVGAIKLISEAGLDTKTALQIFGREAASGASSLALAAEEVDEFIQRLDAAEGTTVRMAEVMADGLPGSVDQFRSSLESLQLELGDSGLRGLMIKVLDTIKGLLRWITDAPGPLKTLLVAVIAAGPGLLAMSVGLKALAIGFRPLTTAIRTTVRLVTHWRASLRLLRMRVSRVTRGLRRFATAIWSRVSPALTALGKGVKAAGLAVRDFAVRLWTRGTAALGRFATSVRTNAIPALSRFAATIWASTIGALRALGRRLAMASLAMLRFAGRAIVAGIAGVAAFAASIWTGAVPALAAFAAGVWATTIALLANPLTWIVLGIVALIAALVLLVKNWDTVKRVVRDFFDRYGNYVLAALAVVAPFIAVPLLIAKNWDQIVGIVGGIWSRVYETVKGWIDAIISFIKEIPGKVKDAVKDIPNMVTDAVKDIPVVGQVLDVAGGVADKAKGLLGGIGKALGLAEGGIVPGPLGRPLLATVHGGEMVLPVGASRVIAQMLEGFRLGPAALPQAPHYYGQMYRSLVDNRSVTVNITEPIVIQTQATDAKGIAQELREEIQDQVSNIAYDHDGPVER